MPWIGNENSQKVVELFVATSSADGIWTVEKNELPQDEMDKVLAAFDAARAAAEAKKREREADQQRIMNAVRPVRRNAGRIING